jgi:hypothetical protein
MDTYDINYNNPEDGELYSISIVDSPANGLEFIALSNSKKELIKLADKKKQLLTGVVLVPEQLIYREFEDGTPFQIKFSSETIERLSQDFLIKGYQKNSTYNHTGSYLEGISLVEQWIVQDSNNDKSSALGFKDLPKGTWMATMKLSDELWLEYIESGKAKGFSIDSFLDLQKISMSNKNKNNNKIKKEKMSLLKKLIKMFAEGETAVTIQIEGMNDLMADAFEVGNIVYEDVEGDFKPFVSMSFEFDGFAYVTDEAGSIVSKDAVEAVEVEMEGEVEVEDAIVIVEEVVEVIEEATTIEELEATVATLTESIEIISNEKEAILKENVELKMKLKAKPNSFKLKANEVSVNPTQMDTLRSIIAKGK